MGFTILRDRTRRALTINMAGPIEAAAREHIPEYVAGATRKEMGLPTGKKAQQLADSMRTPELSARKQLTRGQKETRTIAGKTRWYEKVTPSVTLGNHRLACVLSHPPPEALLIAKYVLADAYDARHDGITFGGGGISSEPRLGGSMSADFAMADGARKALECTADSTWDGLNVYALLLTLYGVASHTC